MNLPEQLRSFPQGGATDYTFHHTTANGFPRLLPPIRKIGLGRRALAGMMPSEKQRGGRIAQFESSLERDFFVLLEFDTRVLRWDPQPVRLSVDEGRPSYVPDVLVSYLADQHNPQSEYRVLYEIKYRDELRKKWAILKPRFRAAQRYAKEHGWKFKLVTEREIRGSGLLWNAKFLLPYTHDPITDGEQALLIKSLRRLGAATPASLLAACSREPWEKARLLAALWRLVATRDVRCDLSTRLNMATEIWARD